MIFDTSNTTGRQNAIKHFKAFLDAKKVISISEHQYKRTMPQNKLYWLYLSCIEQETGNDKEDLHEYFKLKFNGIEVVQLFGEAVYSPRSTTKNNTKQMTEYIDKIIRFAAMELEIALPNPDDKHFLEFYEKYYNE